VCGGIATNFSRLPKVDLKKFYDDRALERFERAGFVEFKFWDKKPVLPVRIEGNKTRLRHGSGEVKILDWGNRDKNAPFPATGWAAEKSIAEGKWAKYHPKSVKIIADRGLEKKVWFDFPKGEIEGLLVEKSGEERVYMLTQQADSEYIAKTGHDRMPIGEKSDFNKSS